MLLASVNLVRNSHAWLHNSIQHAATVLLCTQKINKDNSLETPCFVDGVCHCCDGLMPLVIVIVATLVIMAATLL